MRGNLIFLRSISLRSAELFLYKKKFSLFFLWEFYFYLFLFPNTFFIIRFFIYLLSAPIKSFTVSSENISNDFLKVFFSFFPLFYFSFKLCWKWWSKRFLTFVTIYLPHCILPFSKIKMLLYCETTFRSVKGFRKKILFVIDGNVYSDIISLYFIRL